jgi:hypothetical protein
MLGQNQRQNKASHPISFHRQPFRLTKYHRWYFLVHPGKLAETGGKEMHARIGALPARTLHGDASPDLTV